MSTAIKPIVIQSSELKKMISLVLYPLDTQSFSKLKLNIQLYGELESLCMYSKLIFGKELINSLDLLIDEVSPSWKACKLNKYDSSDTDIISKVFKQIETLKTNLENNTYSNLLTIYIFHNCNKNSKLYFD